MLIFGRFWTSKNEPKSMKKRTKVDPKIHTEMNERSDAIFYDLVLFWPSFRNPNRWEIGPRAPRSRKTKILTKHWQGQQKSRFGLPKNDEKSPKKTLRKAAPKKIGQKMWRKRFSELLGLVSGAPNARFSKVLRNFSKLAMRPHAKRQESGRSHRALQLGDCLPGLSKY